MPKLILPSNLEPLSSKDNKEFFEGVWKLDERLIRLEEAIEKYWKELDASFGSQAHRVVNQFRDWRLNNGYTLEEYNRAKRNVERRGYR